MKGFRRHTGKLIALALLAAVAGWSATFPWKPFLENKIKASLESQGLSNARLTLDSIGFHEIKLRDLSWGDAPAPLLAEITLTYAPWDLLQGKLQSLDLRRVALEAQQGPNGWALSGLAPSPSATKAEPFTIPTTAAEIATLSPLNQAKLSDSRLTFAAKDWQAVLPLQATWEKAPTPTLAAQANGFSVKAGALALQAESLKTTATLDAGSGKWQGDWSLANAVLSGVQPPLPPLSGQGTLSAQARELTFGGELHSADLRVKGRFQLTYDLADPNRSILRVTETSFPWNGGELSAQTVSVPLGARKPIDITLKLRGLSLDSLLQQLTGKKANATGQVSGTLPITIKADGSLAVHRGNLAAESPGEIRLSPDAIPGDNAQVALVRDVLKNLHYRMLSIDVEGGDGNKLTVLLKIQGRNPDLYGGKPVHLNVKLTGDVLSFVQQNLLSLTNPQEFLKRSGHETP